MVKQAKRDHFFGGADMNRSNRVVKLLKNRLYPTYQLHAYMASDRLSAQEGLRLAALTAFGSWMPGVRVSPLGPDKNDKKFLQLFVVLFCSKTHYL